MSVNWGGYAPFDPGVTRPLHEATKREARSAFQRLMAAKDERVAVLRQLLERNGVALSSEGDGLHALNNWFRSEVEGATGRLLPIWYGVVNDLALFLGDAIVATSPENLKWVMFDKGSRDIAFQRHVIMGFSGVANPKYNVDIDRLVATYGHRIIAGEQVATEAFATWIAAAASKA
ncbi:hypothetical protein SAMN05428985_10225 [Nocardioides sp. YR527]|uniref:hypothetical protein n=1 Tax=Nocardioides sp. YR527 TaxID=1881028 RepID=UPI00088A7B34|nr:hypothetical protein [Nocardioides sp. YR527]SDJ96126.1 hypothetical protein SAMN05428985_10225 [Nocardioides sp. YR527]